MINGHNHTEAADAMKRLNRSGWSIGDTAFIGAECGSLTWMVIGHNGENVIRAEGATQHEA